MNDAAIKAFVALIPVCALFTGATIIFVRRRSMSSFLQLVGAAGLVTVIPTGPTAVSAGACTLICVGLM